MSKDGLRKYDGVARNICNIKKFSSLSELSEEERDSYLGVCMVLAFMKGISSDLSDLAYHLKVEFSSLQKPYFRLKINEVFEKNYDARNDSVLLGRPQLIEGLIDCDHRSEIAWCNLAGVSSGHVGIKFEKTLGEYNKIKEGYKKISLEK